MYEDIIKAMIRGLKKLLQKRPRNRKHLQAPNHLIITITECK